MALVTLLTLCTRLSAQEKIYLRISNPQPRVGEEVTLSADLGAIRSKVFGAYAGLMKASEVNYLSGSDKMLLPLRPDKKGRIEFPPLQLEINGINYVSNSLNIEVIDRLPDVDNGFWVRAVRTSDSSFSLIYEQRSPAIPTIRQVDSLNFVEDLGNHHSAFAEFNHIDKDGLIFDGGETRQVNQSITVAGEQKKVLTLFSILHFKMNGGWKKFTIRPEDFENLPKSLYFTPILVQ